MKEEIEYNLTISIKAIVMFEKLTGKPFSKCLNDPNCLLPLIYCVLFAHPENKIRKTYQELLPLLTNEKIIEPIAVGIKNEIDILNQFEGSRDTSTYQVVDLSSEQNKSGQGEREVFMKDLIPILVTDCGLDINYIMDKMPYTDVDDYMRYRQMKREDEMETQRFWTYLQIIPQVGTKKIKKPEDLVKFPWEKKKNEEKFNKNLNTAREELKKLGILEDKEEAK